MASSSNARPEVLSIDTCRALEAAKAETLSYSVRLLLSPAIDTAPSRVVVVLGEAHMKLSKAYDIGFELVRRFDLRGVETFQSKQIRAGRLLGKLIHLPRVALRKLSFGKVRDSTIVAAKTLPNGHCEELERADHVPFALHAASVYLTALFLIAGASFVSSIAQGLRPESVPMSELAAWLAWCTRALQTHMIALVPAWFLRRHAWSVWIHPLIAIVNVRDTLMANGTVRMLREHPGSSPAVVVMGRAHVPGYARELIERHGFRSFDA